MLKKATKILFNLIPLKKYLFILIKKFYIPSQSLYQHLTFKGVFNVPSGKNGFKIINTATVIENQLFWKGLKGFEPKSLELWGKLCRNSNMIFDLGANSGLFSLIAKSENPSCTIHAFEPVERVFKVLKKNVSINNFDINLHEIAVSNENGIGYFYDDDVDWTQSVMVNVGAAETAKSREVTEDELLRVETNLITLDSFIEENNITGIDLMKIDVETHEPEVFEGFSKYLKVFKPTLLVEIIRDHVAISLEKQLNGLGYLYFFINEPFGGVDYEVIGPAYQQVDSLRGQSFANFLICSPEKAKSLNLI